MNFGVDILTLFNQLCHFITTKNVISDSEIVKLKRVTKFNTYMNELGMSFYLVFLVICE